MRPLLIEWPKLLIYLVASALFGVTVGRQLAGRRRR